MEHTHGPQVASRQSHTHHHQPQSPHRPRERRRLRWSMMLTGTMMVVEGVAGVLTGSLALLSDAGHMLSHFLALGLAYAAILIASRPTKPERSFGLFRVEILAAFMNGLSLLVIVGYICWEAYQRVQHPVPIAEMQMLVVGIVGLLVNLSTAALLYGVGDGDLNVRGAFLHMLADTLSSVGVVFGALVIHRTGWLWMDPLLSVFIAALIVRWSWSLLRDSVSILMESTPKGMDLQQVLSSLQSMSDDIQSVHDLHVWEITSNMHALTVHITVSADLTVAECDAIRVRAQDMLQSTFHISHAILQFESPNT